MPFECMTASGKASDAASPICGASMILGTSTTLPLSRPSLAGWGSIGRSPLFAGIFCFFCNGLAFVFISSLLLIRFSSSSFWMSGISLWLAIASIDPTGSGSYALLHITIIYFIFLITYHRTYHVGHQATTPPFPARPTTANIGRKRAGSFTEKIFPLSFFDKLLPCFFMFFPIRVRPTS